MLQSLHIAVGFLLPVNSIIVFKIGTRVAANERNSTKHLH